MYRFLGGQRHAYANFFLREQAVGTEKRVAPEPATREDRSTFIHIWSQRGILCIAYDAVGWKIIIPGKKATQSRP